MDSRDRAIEMATNIALAVFVVCLSAIVIAATIRLFTWIVG